MNATLHRLLDTLNEDGLSCVLDFAVALSAVPTYRRPQHDQLPPAKPLTLVPKPAKVEMPPLVEPHEPYFVCDSAGRVYHTSPALVQWLHATPDALDWESWGRFVDGEDELKRVLELWMVAAQTKQPFNYTVRCKTALGEIVYGFVRVRPCWHPSGNFMGFIGTVHPQILPARVRVSTQEQSA